MGAPRSPSRRAARCAQECLVHLSAESSIPLEAPLRFFSANAGNHILVPGRGMPAPEALELDHGLSGTSGLDDHFGFATSVGFSISDSIGHFRPPHRDRRQTTIRLCHPANSRRKKRGFAQKEAFPRRAGTKTPKREKEQHRSDASGLPRFVSWHRNHRLHGLSPIPCSPNPRIPVQKPLLFSAARSTRSLPQFRRDEKTS